MLTEKDLVRIQNEMREAEKDDTPFLVMNDDEIGVVGDANEVKDKSFDASIVFRFPKSYLSKIDGAVEAGNYCLAEIEYKNCKITAQMDIPLLSAFMILEPFLQEVSKDGESEMRETEELEAIVRDNVANRKILNAIYDVVAIVCGVDDELKSAMYYESVFETFWTILRTFPEVLNESYFFTSRRWLEQKEVRKQAMAAMSTESV